MKINELARIPPTNASIMVTKLLFLSGWNKLVWGDEP
jgi:hypothetical protein